MSCYSWIIQEDWEDREFNSDYFHSNRITNEYDWNMQWIIQNSLQQTWNLSIKSSNLIDKIHRWNQTIYCQQSSFVLHISSLIFFYIFCNFFINFSYNTW